MNHQESQKQLLHQAIAHHQTGAIEQAKQSYQQLLTLNPNHPDGLHLLGGIAASEKRFAEAEQLIKQAIHWAPKVSLYHGNLAMVYLRQENYTAALDASLRATKLDPNNSDAHGHAGVALHHLARFEEAHEAYARALKVNPKNVHVLNNLGNLYKNQSDYAQAEAHFREALAIEPRYREARLNLAGILLRLDRAEEAEHVLTAMRLAEDTDYFNLLGKVCQLQGKTKQAKRAYQKALAIEDRPLWRARAISVCPVIAPNKRSIRAWRRRFLEEIQALPIIDLDKHIDEIASSHAQPPWHLAYQGEGNLALKKAYASKFKAKVVPLQVPKREKPHIGMLVTEGHEGIFLKCCLGIINHWPSADTVLTVVAPARSISVIKKQVTNPQIEYLTLPNHFREMVTVLRERAFNLLYYWEIGSDAINYFLPFFKPAPIQCTSWGTSETTGIQAVDYYLSSRMWEDERFSGDYSEKLVLLDRVPTYYYPPKAPAVPLLTREDLGIEKDEHFYLCVQNLFKLHPDFDELILALLKEDPKGKLVLTEGKQAHWSLLLKQRLEKSLKEEMSRVIFVPRMNYDTYLSLVQIADVVLDSLYFSGGNTSYEALSLGQTIVTLPGQHIRGKFTLGCYRTVSYEKTVSRSVSGFLQIARAHAISRQVNCESFIENCLDTKTLFCDELVPLEMEKLMKQLVYQKNS